MLHSPTMDQVVTGGGRCGGSFELPGDKSVSHRAVMLAAVALGDSRILNLAPGADVASTVGCLRALGVEIEIDAGMGGAAHAGSGAGHAMGGAGHQAGGPSHAGGHEPHSRSGTSPSSNGNSPTSNGNSPNSHSSTAHSATGTSVISRWHGLSAVVKGRGIGALRASQAPLDCGNSGTTARLLAGLLTAVPGTHILTGDSSLSRRPMERVAAPLRELGANIAGTGSPATLPLTVTGSGQRLAGGTVAMGVASAQVKSAVLLAGLNAAGPVTVVEQIATRDHTERLMSAMGIAVKAVNSPWGMAITVTPGVPAARDMVVPGDTSSAAFLVALGVHDTSSGVVVRNVGLNPGRIGFFTVLQRMGANLSLKAGGEALGEPVGTVTTRPSTLVGTEVGPMEVAAMIDELPVLAAVATQCHGETVVRGAGELRVKESDRILAICRGLGALGAQIAPLPDGFVVKGPVQLRGGSAAKPVVVDSMHDHRIAMSLAVAAMWCGAGEQVVIRGAECVGISDPGFFARLEGMRG